MSPDECKKHLRYLGKFLGYYLLFKYFKFIALYAVLNLIKLFNIILELDAYAKMVSVLRAQGPLTDSKQKLLKDLAATLHISNERHQAEVRRAVNDDKLTIISERFVN